MPVETVDDEWDAGGGASGEGSGAEEDKYLSSVLSLFRDYRRLRDPELFNFRHRYRSILFNSLDSINYTGVRLL